MKIMRVMISNQGENRRAILTIIGGLLMVLYFSGCQVNPTPTATIVPTSTQTATIVPTSSQPESSADGISTELKIPDLPIQEGKTWLEIDPGQCTRWWRDENGDIDITSIQEHYAEKGFEVYDMKTITFAQKFGEIVAICDHCSCPQGFTLYVLVADADVDALLAIGYRNIVENCKLVPPGIYVYGCSH